MCLWPLERLKASALSLGKGEERWEQVGKAENAWKLEVVGGVGNSAVVANVCSALFNP